LNGIRSFCFRFPELSSKPREKLIFRKVDERIEKSEMSGNLRHLGHQKPGNQNRQHEGKLRISKNRVRAA